ncbi:hypothetical protein V493_01874 [Pseudogymnoascus sp. VKM F-4281 (FW-2241)]|nr:hypothetical protein V493_01874 [Pseudogymnoascus sp. VKM F-4281 (FW-2241)]
MNAASSWPAKWPSIEPDDDLHVFDPNGDVLLQLNDDFEDLDLATREEPVAQDDTSLFNGEEPSDLQSEGVHLQPRSTQTDYLRVSSKHLILASAMFRTMLSSDKFVEGQRLRSDGNLVMRLSDDSEALIILMNTIHGITKSIPRKVTLETLTELAILINYYQLHEVVGLASEMWIADLKQKSFPTCYVPEVINWLFISWVFLMRDEFARLTRILELESDDRLEDKISKSRFIPASIISRIQELRIEAITDTITLVHHQINMYLTSDKICPENKQFACDAIVLGSLLKSFQLTLILRNPLFPRQPLLNSLLLGSRWDLANARSPILWDDIQKSSTQSPRNESY